MFRGIPWLSSLLLRHIRAGEAVPTFDRIGIAGCLTAQFAFGGILGIALQGLLAVLIVGYVMPHLGIGLLDLANALIDFDLPARVGHLFRVSP